MVVIRLSSAMSTLAVVAVVALALAGSVSAQVAGCAGLGSSAQQSLINGFRSSVACMAGLPAYPAGGSKAGQVAINARRYDYALSDVPLLPCNPRKVVNVAFAVGLMSVYMKRAGTRLTGCAAAGIYTGTVATWNNAALSNVNPALRTATGAIIPIRRTDESGTTWTFTNWLTKSCRSKWSFQQVYRFEAVVALRPFVAKTAAAAASGTSGVVAKYNTNAGNVIYVASERVSAAADEALLQVNTGAQTYFRHTQANFGLLNPPSGTLGNPTCSNAADITGLRVAVYPFAFLAWFLAWQKTARPTQKACVRVMCNCLLSAAGQTYVNTQTEFKGISAGLAPTMRARCALL